MQEGPRNTYAAIIVAAGRGTRAGGDIPKQWQPLAGRRVIDWTVEAFQKMGVFQRIVVVLHPDDTHLLPPGCEMAVGGDTRSASVRSGLEALADTPPSHVLIQDAARACVSSEVIHSVLTALETTDGAAPGLPVTDALWQSSGGTVQAIAPRKGVFRAQTPQGFRFDSILTAHRTGTDAADDVALAIATGIEVTITPGAEDNLKITTADDFARAERILNERSAPMMVRTGNGFDVHAFGPGDHVTLCGVELPHAQGLVGHSDADVGMHAVTDAIYGALAEGDIGQHFPPSDPQWKGAASHIFLEHAATLAREKGFDISNIDCTLVCETPKIGPHADKMRAALATIMQLEPDQVSVKATTSERLGFTGREEGIAAIASATLVKP